MGIEMPNPDEFPEHNSYTTVPDDQVNQRTSNAEDFAEKTDDPDDFVDQVKDGEVVDEPAPEQTDPQPEQPDNQENTEER
jgi:hypothetical protein